MTVPGGMNLLSRMEAAHRYTRAHLERIERQISARAERMTTTARTKARSRTREGSRWTRGDEATFRAYVDELSFERRGEIEALSRKLIRQEHAITVVRAKTISNGPAGKADAYPALWRQEHVRQATVISFTLGAGGMPSPAGLPSVLVAVVNRRPEPSRPLTRRGAAARTILAKPVPRDCARAC